MTETKGTQDLVELVDLVLTGVDIVKKAKADGKIGFEDAGLLLAVIPALGPAMAGIDQIPAELKDLSGDEAQALIAHVMAKLSLENSKAQAVAESALKFAAAGWGLFSALKLPSDPVQA
jgi:hypothetical protein